MDTKIRDAFVNGIYKIYSTFYTDSIEYYTFNEEYSVSNIYGESKEKYYNNAVSLVGKVTLGSSLNNRPEQDINYDCEIKIPKKSFDLVNIITPLDTKKFIKGKLKYKSTELEILSITPGVNIVDTYMTYIIYCKVVK